MGHGTQKKYSFYEAHYADKWYELKGQLWSAYAENQKLKQKNELLEKALDEINLMYQKLLLETNVKK